MLEELGGYLAFGGEDDAIFCEDTKRCTSMRDCFKGIFDLVEAAFGGEDGRLMEKEKGLVEMLRSWREHRSLPGSRICAT